MVDVFIQLLPPGKQKRKIREDGTEISGDSAKIATCIKYLRVEIQTTFDALGLQNPMFSYVYIILPSVQSLKYLQ